MNSTYRHDITSRRWLQLRKQKLTNNPLCERCYDMGLVTAASEVHHREPVESVSTPTAQTQLMFDYDNLMSVCHDCHVALHIELKKNSRTETKKRNKTLVAHTISKFFGE